MVHDPWRHDIFGYGYGVPRGERLHPDLLLLNKQLRGEILERWFERCKLTLHTEFRNDAANGVGFEFSPHVLRLPMLRFVTHARFYVEWNYEITTARARVGDQVAIARELVRGTERVLRELEGVEAMEVMVLFFWKKRGGKHYMLSMQDLFELEDVFKREGEERWLRVLRRGGGQQGSEGVGVGEEDPAGVGYKLSCEDRGTEQSGGMEIFVSRDLEEAMRTRRKSMVDFYGNYGIEDPLPPPAYEVGKMI